MVIKKLREINANRGRKSTNRKIFVKHLQELYKVSDENGLGVGMLAKILTSVISALFEMNNRVLDAMDFNSWKRHELFIMQFSFNGHLLTGRWKQSMVSSTFSMNIATSLSPFKSTRMKRI